MKIGGKGQGGSGDFPKPDPGKYVATLAHIYDIGVQTIQYPGQDATKSQRLALIWELNVDAPNGQPFVVVDEVPVSLYKSSKMREACVALLDRPVDEDEEFDSAELIGRCAVLYVVHKGKDGSFVGIDSRAALQDASKAFSPRGSYGPSDTIHNLVAWKMRQAEPGTVPEGQGVMPVKGSNGNEQNKPTPTPSTPATPDTEPGTDGDDIPF